MSVFELLLVILLVAWVGGLAFHIAGGLIHILLVVAVVVFIARMLRRA